MRSRWCAPVLYWRLFATPASILDGLPTASFLFAAIPSAVPSVRLQFFGMAKVPFAKPSTGSNDEYSRMERQLGSSKSSGPIKRIGAAMEELATTHELVIPREFGILYRSASWY